MVVVQTPPSTQLYLTLPDPLPEHLEQEFEKLLVAGGIVSVMLDVESASRDKDLTRKLILAAQNKGVAFLLGVSENTLQQGLAYLDQWQADGLHLCESGMAVAEIRKKMGQGYILGSFCGMSRHNVMEAGENGADYLALGSEPQSVQTGGVEIGDGQEVDQILVLIKWCLEVFELPVVAWNCRDMALAKSLVAVETDFVAVDDMVWQSGDAPEQVLTQLKQITGK